MTVTVTVDSDSDSSRLKYSQESDFFFDTQLVVCTLLCVRYLFLKNTKVPLLQVLITVPCHTMARPSRQRKHRRRPLQTRQNRLHLQTRQNHCHHCLWRHHHHHHHHHHHCYYQTQNSATTRADAMSM